MLAQKKRLDSPALDYALLTMDATILPEQIFYT
jgi:hypothetical protein